MLHILILVLPTLVIATAQLSILVSVLPIPILVLPMLSCSVVYSHSIIFTETAHIFFAYEIAHIFFLRRSATPPISALNGWGYFKIT